MRACGIRKITCIVRLRPISKLAFCLVGYGMQKRFSAELDMGRRRAILFHIPLALVG